MARSKLDDPRYYLNRHVQWLDFNRRVLEEARDPGNPLLERVKFLAITANNLDEFVEVRVSSFLQRIEHVLSPNLRHSSVRYATSTSPAKASPALRCSLSVLHKENYSFP